MTYFFFLAAFFFAAFFLGSPLSATFWRLTFVMGGPFLTTAFYFFDLLLSLGWLGVLGGVGAWRTLGENLADSLIC